MFHARYFGSPIPSHGCVPYGRCSQLPVVELVDAYKKVDSAEIPEQAAAGQVMRREHVGCEGDVSLQGSFCDAADE